MEIYQKENREFKEEDEISLSEVILKFKNSLNLLKLKIKKILLIFLIGSILGITVAYFVKPQYKGLMTFVVEEDKGVGGGLGGALGSASGLASTLGIDLGSSSGGVFSPANIPELMKSRLLIEKTLLNPIIQNGKTISLAECYIQTYNLRKKWGDKNELKNIKYLPNSDRKTFSLQQDSLLRIIYQEVVKNNLIIQQKEKKVSIFTLEVISESENFSKDFCEILTKEVSAFYVETKSKKARINTEILERQADSIRNELNKAISGVTLFADNVYNLNPAFTNKTTPSKKRQVDVQANTAILTQLVAQLELSKITLRKETPLFQIIDRPILPLEKDRLRKSMSAIFGGLILTILYIIRIFLIDYYKKSIYTKNN